MTRIPTRPKPLDIGPLTARVVLCRGAGGQLCYPREDGRWYWQARFKDTRVTVWVGWATRGEAAVRIAEVVAALPGSGAPAGTAVETVGTLLRSWASAQDSGRDTSGDSNAIRRTHTGRLMARVANVPPDLVQTETLESVRDARLLEGCSPQAVARELMALRLAWTWGQDGR